MNTLIINLFGGPGCGKSTAAADVFAGLKWKGVDCEMALEFAKDKVWEKSYEVLQNQIYVFGKQLHRVHRLIGQVEVVITDSPLPFSLMYGDNESYAFKALVLEVFNRYNNENFLLHRTKGYNPNGRMQTEEEAKVLDKKMKNLLIDNKILYTDFEATKENIQEILIPAIMKKVGK